MLERLDNPQRREALRWKYGLPPKGNANFARVQHFIYQLSLSGFAGCVLANGTPVSANYKAKDHFPFTGQIDKVVINLIPDPAK